MSEGNRDPDALLKWVRETTVPLSYPLKWEIPCVAGSADEPADEFWKREARLFGGRYYGRYSDWITGYPLTKPYVHLLFAFVIPDHRAAFEKYIEEVYQELAKLPVWCGM